ncbi:MAG: rod shape-determining protein RodA [Bacteroidia bacterium]|nr:rod shape-determining protein RodA [Bacteroidia bacterium]MDW8089481.1 FtsW/RodA/SpoVE family cell cycle protein [Bacteroidia bacterium]
MRRWGPDWILFGLVLGLMSIGILNLYSIEGFPPLRWSYAYTRQLVWMGLTLLVMVAATWTEGQVWRYFSYGLYGLGVGLMLLTAFVAREVKGARAWLDLGGFRFQPSEFMKVVAALGVAAYLSRYDFDWRSWRDRLMLVLLLGVPAGLALLQQDTGTALTYSALLVPLYRHGLSGWVLGLPLILGLLAFATLVYSWVYVGAGATILLLLVGWLLRGWRRNLGLLLLLTLGLWAWVGVARFLYERILASHQKQRIEALLNPYRDPLGAGWHVIQTRIAVTAGGLTGQGYGKGLQSKLDFIPQRHTDFAFCGIAEEWGWLGATTFLILYGILLWRLTWLGEASESEFLRLYTYGLTAFLWLHLILNVGMIVGFLPVIGVPLIFLSYGGSSWVAMGWGIGILQSLYRERQTRLFG